jgi:hypothetical protein
MSPESCRRPVAWMDWLPTVGLVLLIDLLIGAFGRSHGGQSGEHRSVTFGETGDAHPTLDYPNRS